MAELIALDLYSDVHCPYAYLTAFRLRRLRESYRGHVQIVHKSLSLEYVNKRSTPKEVLASETPFLMLEEPDIPYEPWHGLDGEWPVTMWPAFEAIKCAERQDMELADDLDWAIRRAFFAESRCISMRHVLFELAEEVGLNMTRFGGDFDGGVAKRVVLQEAQDGWERLKVEGSPTFVLPDGEQRPYVGLPKITLDPVQHHRVVEVRAAEGSSPDCLKPLRQLLAEVEARGRTPTTRHPA